MTSGTVLVVGGGLVGLSAARLALGHDPPPHLWKGLDVERVARAR